ncbi:polysaccharide deacetylase family protein [Methylacidiphilum caldifontis]|uniref:DUF2334 domain-containing protein n=1 Tax=Methylacidiphilum caldifontis TaxID=2795386 RepID=UPI001A8FD818|nr:polysaccharide deacetylase family protein [Methylacidiphilum caldifontis]QSR89578.1 polysaccharide deacetylase family protein [Methylacidiphilum caldifontis]
MIERSLFVTLHDIHPLNSSKIEKQREQLLSWGVSKMGLLIIPYYHHKKSIEEDEKFCNWVTSRIQAGDEPIIHGFYHDRLGITEKISQLFWTQFYTQQEAEFLNIEEKEAIERLVQAKKMFMNLGWQSKGFIAPGWLYEPPLLDWLRKERFSYTAAIDRIILLESSNPSYIYSFSLCWSNRSLWRRSISQVWNGWLKNNCIKRKKAYVRVAVHPEDSDYRSLWSQLERIVKHFLDLGMEPQTYGILVKS